MSLSLSREKMFLILLVVGAVSIRWWQLPNWLNFSTDQAVFASRAWDLWTTQEFTLAGPTASFSYHGRYLIQSSAIFYQTLLFLLPVNFDPIKASYLMALVASLLCVPLYFGTKILSNKCGAFLITALFAFAPTYVNYTRFLWNPNYQLLYATILIFFLGKYAATQKKWWLAASGLVAGGMVLFHYQFFLAIAVLTLILLLKTPFKKMLWWFGGLLLGLVPILLFELNSRFYLTQTLYLLLTHHAEVLSTEPSAFPTHYFLSLSLLLLTGLITLLVKHFPTVLTATRASIVCVVIVMIGLGRFLVAPAQGFGMANNWNFPLELKASEIITEQNLDNFAVANIVYETTASVQYYLLKINHIPGATKEYQQNQFLFVIAPTGETDLTKNPAYELSQFKPSIVKNTWELSPEYSLYLLQRL